MYACTLLETKVCGDRDLEGHIQNFLSVYIEMDIFNFFLTFFKEKLGSDFKRNQAVNFKFAPNMSIIYSDE